MANQQQDRLTRLQNMYPRLAEVPEEERLGIVEASARHPLFWGPLVALLIVWLILFGNRVMDLVFSSRGDMLVQLLVPVLLPVFVIFVAVFIGRRAAVNRIIDERISE